MIKEDFHIDFPRQRAFRQYEQVIARSQDSMTDDLGLSPRMDPEMTNVPQLAAAASEIHSRRIGSGQHRITGRDRWDRIR